MIWRVRDRATFAALAQARSRRAGPVDVRSVPYRLQPERASVGGTGSREPAPPAVAYAVGRRAGNAVLRNRLRRRLRAAVCERSELLAPDTAYLVAADPAALTMSFEALCDAVARAVTVPDAR